MQKNKPWARYDNYIYILNICENTKRLKSWFSLKDLPEQEKEVYQEMARQSKINKKFAAPRNDRMDCTGQFLSVSTYGHLSWCYPKAFTKN